ncbi:MAG TPA: 50S ribosomal protein L24 [bacterium]|nr:50S ribosomal protein L24 [Candidatus Omnitrophota bacterium]HOJ60521.1 50S ribosomal protein L24 [bacterium]HOL96235.1 50S ribosomal protein L24 [bacterium]HPP02496.1 50S ribosomal protein L24 [bacterium]HXK95034.1 50S ribosomal protein L24 [bacterium]
MERIRLKKGDLVEVITGDDRGKTGKILRIDRQRGRITVQGVNMIKKHKKRNPQANQPGGIIEHEGFIHPSNVRLVK